MGTDRRRAGAPPRGGRHPRTVRGDRHPAGRPGRVHHGGGDVHARVDAGPRSRGGPGEVLHRGARQARALGCGRTCSSRWSTGSARTSRTAASTPATSPPPLPVNQQPSLLASKGVWARWVCAAGIDGRARQTTALGDEVGQPNTVGLTLRPAAGRRARRSCWRRWPPPTAASPTSATSAPRRHLPAANWCRRTAAHARGRGRAELPRASRSGNAKRGVPDAPSLATTAGQWTTPGATAVPVSPARAGRSFSVVNPS